MIFMVEDKKDEVIDLEGIVVDSAVGSDDDDNHVYVVIRRYEDMKDFYVSTQFLGSDDGAIEFFSNSLAARLRENKGKKVRVKVKRDPYLTTESCPRYYSTSEYQFLEERSPSQPPQ